MKLWTLALILVTITGAIATSIRIEETYSRIMIGTNTVALNNTQTWNVESLATGDVNAAQIYTYLNDTMNASEINDAIDDTTMIVMFLKGDYYIEDIIYLKSNKTYIFNPGVTLSWVENATPYNFKMHQDGSPTWFGNITYLIWAENQENIVILNYGYFYPSRIERPFFNKSAGVSSIMNTSNVYYHVGRSTADNTVGVQGGRNGANSWNFNVIVRNSMVKPPVVGSEELSESGQGLMSECTEGLIVENIIGVGSEGVDFNNKVKNGIISELMFYNRLNDQTEVVDLDYTFNIMASNVLGNNYDNVATLQTGSGYRFADCTLAGNRNAHVRATCNSCRNAAELDVLSTLIVADGNEYYMANASINMQGNNLTDVNRLKFTSGTTWS